MFSCRNIGETGREEFIFLAPAGGDLPGPNFFFLQPIWRTGNPPKLISIASLEVNIYLNFANLASYRHE
jgi:hypothetical protein